ncbi:hypothetical protein LOK49_LG10G00548 [Camellia lanceoleosa]|uniref:Uncharacterized protein n=1 Tax=Camellia lanceoleosa TaxID=1840588 RepID=A0ACC0GCU3_9ERIC|nr:hypothetical protein LOK49_LG10G00548 [Camellia lanceoleosa]
MVLRSGSNFTVSRLRSLSYANSVLLSIRFSDLIGFVRIFGFVLIILVGGKVHTKPQGHSGNFTIKSLARTINNRILARGHIILTLIAIGNENSQAVLQFLGFRFLLRKSISILVYIQIQLVCGRSIREYTVIAWFHIEF